MPGRHKGPGGITAPGSMKCTFVSRSRTVARSMSRARRRRTSATPICLCDQRYVQTRATASPGSRSTFAGAGKATRRPADRTVKKLDPSGEFGFLEAADGHEVYFHRNSVLDGAFSRLAVGASHVTFAEEMGEKGPRRARSRLLGKHGLRHERLPPLSPGARPVGSIFRMTPMSACGAGARPWRQAFEQAALRADGRRHPRRGRAARSRSRCGARRPTSSFSWSNGSMRSSTRWRCGKCCSGGLPCGSRRTARRDRCGASRSISSAMRRPASRRAPPIRR